MNPDYTILLFYKFTDIEDPHKLRDEQKSLCERLHLTGRMYLAKEGINATFEGKHEDIEAYKKAVSENPIFKGIVFKESKGTGNAFSKLKIKVRDEVVTLGAGAFDIQKDTAKEISAKELHELYAKDEDFVILDLRNDFEVDVGYFEKTVDPKLAHFRDLPEKLPELEYLKNKKIITVCTGGIRCEKATCLMKQKGFENLYQLKDGIHTYMKEYPGKHFKGSLFVFDNRLTTAVVETPEIEIVGRCFYCEKECEDFYNDDSVKPSKKVICCNNCIKEKIGNLRKS